MKNLIYLIFLVPFLATSQGRYAPVTSAAKDSTKILTTFGGAPKWTYNLDIKVDTSSLSRRIDNKIDSFRAVTQYTFVGYANGVAKSIVHFDSSKIATDSIAYKTSGTFQGYAETWVETSDTSYNWKIAGNTFKIKVNGSGSTTSTTTPTYLTWTTIGSDMEQYNSSLGMRKKTTASAGWNAAGKSLAVQTLSSGQSLTVKIGTANAYAVMLSDITTPDEGSVTGIKYGFYPDINGTVAVTQVNNATVGGTISVAVGDLMRITYNAQMAFDQSTDGGTTWTNKYTSTGTAPTGSYYIVVQSYSVGGGYSEIYKR